MNCLNCKAAWQIKVSQKGVKYYKCDSCTFWCPADRNTEQPLSKRGTLNGLSFDPCPTTDHAPPQQQQQQQTANIPPTMISGTISATLIRMVAVLTELSGTIMQMQKQIAAMNSANVAPVSVVDDVDDMPPPAPPVKRQRQD